MSVRATGYRADMIIVGLVCMLLGLVLGVPILWTIGIVLLVVGAVLLLVGRAGHPVHGRTHYW